MTKLGHTLTAKMLRPDLRPEDFPDREPVILAEGGAVCTAERDGRFYVIVDERTVADLLDEDRDEFVKVWEFSTAADRGDYLIERGWHVGRTG